MVVYVSTFLVSSICAFLSDCFALSKRRLRTRKSLGRGILSIFFFILAGLSLAVVRGVRYNVGYDYSFSYLPSFLQVLDGGESHYEPLFNLLLKIITAFTSDYRVYFFIDSLLFIALVWIAISLFCSSFFLPVVIFVGGYDYFRSFCYMAQYLAMSVCLLAVVALMKRKILLSVVCILAAANIHLSAALFLIVPLIYLFSKKISSFKSLLFLVVIIEICILPLKVIIPNLYKYTRFSYYNGTSYDNGDIQIALILINVGILIFLMCTGYFCYDKDPNVIAFAILLQSLAVAFSLLQGDAPLVFRLVWYFMFPYIFFVPRFVETLYSSKLMLNKVFAILATCIFIIAVIYITFYDYIPGNLDYILPYRTIFDSAIS